MNLLQEAVAHELGLDWHDDPLRYPYLRQRVLRGYRRGGVVAMGDRRGDGNRIVGYSVLRPTAPRQDGAHWIRRTFWCKESDRDGSRWPPAQEAVDPRLIQPRVLTPWLFEDHSDEMGPVDWLRMRRAELGLSDGQTVSFRPVLDG